MEFCQGVACIYVTLWWRGQMRSIASYLSMLQCSTATAGSATFCFTRNWQSCEPPVQLGDTALQSKPQTGQHMLHVPPSARFANNPALQKISSCGSQKTSVGTTLGRRTQSCISILSTASSSPTCVRAGVEGLNKFVLPRAAQAKTVDGYIIIISITVTWHWLVANP